MLAVLGVVFSPVSLSKLGPPEMVRTPSRRQLVMPVWTGRKINRSICSSVQKMSFACWTSKSNCNNECQGLVGCTVCIPLQQPPWPSGATGPGRDGSRQRSEAQTSRHSDQSEGCIPPNQIGWYGHAPASRHRPNTNHYVLSQQM